MKLKRIFRLIIKIVGPCVVLGSLAAGCSRQEGSESESSVDQAAVPSATRLSDGSVEAGVAGGPSAQIPGLPPPSAEIVTLMETNKSAILEHQIFYVEKSSLSRWEKAQALFKIYSSIDKEGQRKAAHAAVRYVDDEHFVVVRHQMLDSSLPKQVLSVFLTDTLKRSDAVKMPLLLELAQRDGHPMQGEARQLLSAFLGRDYGLSWDKWQEAMVAYLDTNRN